MNDLARLNDTSLTVRGRLPEPQLSFSPEQRDLIKRTIARGATDDELALFEIVCRRTGLNPFVRQIYAIKRNEWDPDLNDGKGGWTKKMAIQTGIDGYRLIAERTGRYDGQDGPYWCDDSGEWRDVWLADAPPSAAKVVIYKTGASHGFTGVATYGQYAQTKRGGEPNAMWAKMPALMLAKCAEALALRKAFPQELSSVYTDDEMGQADSGRLGGEMAPPAQPAGAIVPTLDLIKKVRTVDLARELVHRSSSAFRALMPRAISDTQGKDPTWFWANATSVKEWKEVLEYAVELHDQQQHDETSAAGTARPPRAPAADPQSDPPPASPSGDGSDDPTTDSDHDG